MLFYCMKPVQQGHHFSKWLTANTHWLLYLSETKQHWVVTSSARDCPSLSCNVSSPTPFTISVIPLLRLKKRKRMKKLPSVKERWSSFSLEYSFEESGFILWWWNISKTWPCIHEKLKTWVLESGISVALLVKTSSTCWQYSSWTWSQNTEQTQLSTTNYCKINPTNTWQNSPTATGSLLICITFNHIILPKKSCLQSSNAHFTSPHLQMVSCCVQFSTAIVITAKGFLSSLLRFCSHSCSMSLQDNLKWKRKRNLKNPNHILKKQTTKMDQRSYTLYFAIKPELILSGFLCFSFLFLSPQ